MTWIVSPGKDFKQMTILSSKHKLMLFSRLLIEIILATLIASTTQQLALDGEVVAFFLFLFNLLKVRFFS